MSANLEDRTYAVTVGGVRQKFNGIHLPDQPLSSSDYWRVRELKVGQDFYDADGDRWERVQ